MLPSQEVSQGFESAEQSLQQPSGLCTACLELDLVSSTAGRCPPPDKDGWHTHLGSLENVVRKQDCPCCRLILAATGFVDADTRAIRDTAITIRSRAIHGSIRPKTWDEGDMFDSFAHLAIFFEVSLENFYGRNPCNDDSAVGSIIRADSATSPSGGICTPSTHEYYVRGRTVAPEINIDLIKRWLRSCDSEHTICRNLLLGDGEHTIRLIDVENEQVLSASLAEEYVALSYVWGRDTAPLLTRGTLPQYTSLRGLRGSTIPRTIADAIQFVRAIGKRYLWVDSLCIVQDDDGEKQQQLPHMDAVYRHADLVIIAAAGSDAHRGIPGVGNTERSMLQHREAIQGVEFIATQPAAQQALDWTTWMTRGWTFQEATLARRALIFTEHVVYWNCREATWREDMTGDSLGDGVKLGLTDNTSIWGSLAERRVVEVCRTAFYCRQVTEFSRRVLKDERDVLWAFLGILKLQAPRFPKGFIWGHPYERLDATLLWSEGYHCSNVHPRNVHHIMVHGNTSYGIPYPSWSWLSTTTLVSFLQPCGDSIISRVTWHKPLKLEDDENLATYLKSTTGSKDATDDADDRELSTDWLSGVDGMDFGLLHFTARTARLRVKNKQIRSVSIPDTNTTGQVPDNATSEEGIDRYYIQENNTGDAVDHAAEQSSNEERVCEVNSTRDTWVEATVHARDRACIGVIEVPVSFFRGQPERLGELVVLSSNAELVSDGNCRELSGGLDCGTIDHAEGCSHVQSHNIMLIEWNEGIAYRRGLSTVSVNEWQNIKTQEKRIVLG